MRQKNLIDTQKIKLKNERIHSYKWEFLRRNKEYQNEYDNFTKAKKNGKEVSWDNRSKYGLFAADYRNKYPGLIKNDGVDEAVVFYSELKPSEVLRVNAWSKQSLADSRWNLSRLKFKAMNPNDVPKLKKMKLLQLIVDIRYPKETLFKNFKTMVNFYKNFVTDIRIDKRKRFGEYDRYLAVYDLFEEGWSWDRLARKFYKADMERSSNYARKKVKRDYERCLKLIDGGYRQIS